MKKAGDSGKKDNGRNLLTQPGVWDYQSERDACGVGFVVRLDGEPRHAIVVDGIQILVNLEHRGAVGGDKTTGDGAGIMMELPHEFFGKVLQGEQAVLPAAGDYAVAMVFLPVEEKLAGRCETVIKRIVREEGCSVFHERNVPCDAGGLGVLSSSTQPHIKQFFISRDAVDPAVFEQKLYVIRRGIEKETAAWSDKGIDQFYIVSFSSRTIVYKGMLTGTQITEFYPDLVDTSFKSAYALVHQRYSTNTLPTWSLAQPFRMVAHNGEINTLRGNINAMRAREAIMSSPVFGKDIDKLKPVIDERGSDSAIFDNVFEFLVCSGRSLPHSMMMMVPEAWGRKYHMSEYKRSFYEFHSAIMEPWDGPAALAFCDGRFIGATLDRNGLRPARYTVTDDGMVVMASEAGVLDIPHESVVEQGRLQPGKMFLVDLNEKRIVPDKEIKARISRQRSYRRWVRENRIELRGLLAPSKIPALDPDVLRLRQHAFGYTDEELRMIIGPMASYGQEPIGSMGNDAALAVLSNHSQLLFSYFKQLFAQVTNPPIDPLREELVMSLMSFVGRRKNVLSESPEHCRMLKLHHPILTPRDMIRLRTTDNPDLHIQDLDMLFSPADSDNGKGLRKGLDRLFKKAEKAIKEGISILVLTDRNMDKDNIPIPVLLAVAGLHHHLIRQGLRSLAGIVVESGEAREVMHHALLIGYGANAVCAHVAFSTIRSMVEDDSLERRVTSDQAMDAYISALKKGLLKTFSRMGISTVRSFTGSQIFEAVGLSSALVDEFFTGTASRIEGIGLREIAEEAVQRHQKAFPRNKHPEKLLPVGGNYHVKVGGEKHLWTSESIYKFRQATWTDDYSAFKEYTKLIDDQSRAHATLRSLFSFKKASPVPLDEVEPVEEIMKRFVTAAMSLGSISRETHECIAIAMNRVGGKSNSGEGGEDPIRFQPLANGDSMRSAIKQIASGRFGVTTEYLVNCDELQIKIAQGAKPGEGGQLPGHKVSDYIASVRHTTPGVTLISPPPHHDIYSIEDLAQLIYDLKAVNPQARVSVKLVSEVGVGTIASGVAKAKADMVLISGHDGGTGASPLSSIKHAGLPWELGLAETQQALINNHLREYIRVQVDGQLKTGRDLAIAALLGAEEFGFGTTVLVAVGCIMMRKCHLNNCPVGVATQNPELRARFQGKPEYVVRFMRFIAGELREYMAQLGFRKLDDMIGHAELLETQKAIEHWKLKGLDFSRIFHKPAVEGTSSLRCTNQQDHDLETALDNQLIAAAKKSLETRTATKSIQIPVSNINRTVGATLSGEIVRRYGAEGLPEETIRIILNGAAGQSLGAFLAPGISMHVEGSANDYLGKGMSGGRIVLVPPRETSFKPEENVIAGNTVLYGATGGELYINGTAGERFAVRNSGAKAVVEGIGDHGCEYMTGGTVAVLGPTGNNFGAGMSGGIAYVYDESELFDTRCNLDMVDLETVLLKEDEKELKYMIEDHVKFTGSSFARMILDNWQSKLPMFVKVMPIEYRLSLERMRQNESPEDETISATEEVYNG